MRLLLDTHTFLWTIRRDQRLGAISRELIHRLARQHVVTEAHRTGSL